MRNNILNCLKNISKLSTYQSLGTFIYLKFLLQNYNQKVGTYLYENGIPIECLILAFQG